MKYSISYECPCKWFYASDNKKAITKARDDHIKQCHLINNPDQLVKKYTNDHTGVTQDSRVPHYTHYLFERTKRNQSTIYV